MQQSLAQQKLRHSLHRWFGSVSNAAERVQTTNGRHQAKVLLERSVAPVLTCTESGFVRMKMFVRWAVVGLSFAAGVANSASAATIRHTGVNLFGAEFGESVLPGTYGQQYTYPNQTE